MRYMEDKFKLLIIQPVITKPEERSNAFINWTKLITYEGNKIILPDGSTLDGKLWINNQLQFDNGSYTNYLIEYYNAIN